MRTSDCSETSRAWPATTHPTFGVACEGCGYTPDGGRCVPLDPGPQALTLNVAGRSYGGAHFEVVGPSCGDERLFRYTGPLELGQRHEILYPGNVDYSRPIKYKVAFDVEEATTTADAGWDVGEPQDAHPDVSRDTRGEEEAAVDGGADAGQAQGGRRAGGCSHVPGALGIQMPLMAVAGMAALGWTRLSRRARRSSLERSR